MNQIQRRTSMTPQIINERYLQTTLKWLRLLLKRRVLWLKSQWQHDPITESGSRVISDPHVAWLLCNADLEAEQRFYAEDRAARELTDAATVLQHELALAQEQDQQESPLTVLAHLFGLNKFEQKALLLCLAAEIDPAFQALFAYVQDDLNRVYPTMYLAYALFAPPGRSPFSIQGAFGVDAPLRRYGLIAVRDEEQPLAVRPLGLPERISDYLRGINHPDADLKSYLRPVQERFSTIGLEGSSQQVLQVVQVAREGGSFPMINLIGSPDSGQREIAATVSAALGIHLFELDLSFYSEGSIKPLALGRLLDREALLLQSAFYIDAARIDGLSESIRRLIQVLDRQTMVLVFIAHHDRLDNANRLVNVGLSRFSSRERQALWAQVADDDLAELDIPRLVQQFHFGPQGMHQAITAARHQAAMQGRPAALTHADLWNACRDQSQWQLDDLAQRIEPTYEWGDLVLPRDVEAQLQEIAAQVSHRHRVYDAWGYDHKLNRGRGISALFAGASGTGKTMAAEVLANYLKLSLYRIDLAGVINKYVGETEKNLRRIFQAAEQSGAILFFDEADALFGKRTDVKDSHDRYANIEVNYLLQLMENYSGLAILATNRRQAIDRAFLRRLRFVVDFVFPNVDSRRRIWRLVFPADVPKEGIDYNRLAKLEIAGGNIHSIALNAAFLAAADGGVVQMTHIMAATRREYAKIDKLEPDDTLGGR